MTKHGILIEKWSVINFSTANPYPIQETLELRFSKAPFIKMNFVQRYSLIPGQSHFHTPPIVFLEIPTLSRTKDKHHSFLNSGSNFPRIKIWRILQTIQCFSETFKERSREILPFISQAEQLVLQWSGGTSWEPFPHRSLRYWRGHSAWDLKHIHMCSEN